jgi:hypothetical protein
MYSVMTCAPEQEVAQLRCLPAASVSSSNSNVFTSILIAELKSCNSRNIIVTQWPVIRFLHTWGQHYGAL